MHGSPDNAAARTLPSGGRARLSRRTFLRLTGLGSAVSLLAACIPVSDPEPAGTFVPPATAESPTVHFHVLNGVYGDAAAARAPAFREVRPEVDLQVQLGDSAWYVQQLEARMADGTAADCFWLPFLPGIFHQQANAGHLARLTDWLGQEPFRQTPFLQEALDAATYQGQLFGIPWTCHPGRTGCYVNLSLLADAGVQPPPADGTWTLEDLHAMARTVTRKEGDQTVVYGTNIGISFAHILILVRAHQGEIYNEYGNRALLQSRPVMQTLDFLYTLLHQDRVMPTPDRLDTYLFEKGNVALSQNGYWGTRTAQTHVGDAFDFTIVPMPQGLPGHAGSMMEIEPLCIHRRSSVQDAAWAWIMFLAAPDTGVQLALQGGVPGARTDVWAHADLQAHPGHRVFARAMQEPAAYRGPGNLRAQEAIDMFNQGMTASWRGGEEPAAVVPALEARLNALLAQPPA